MKLEEAIARLEALNKMFSLGQPELRDEALQLGVEALRRDKQEREWGIPGAKALLPGETKE